MEHLAAEIRSLRHMMLRMMKDQGHVREAIVITQHRITQIEEKVSCTESSTKITKTIFLGVKSITLEYDPAGMIIFMQSQACIPLRHTFL